MPEDNYSMAPDLFPDLPGSARTWIFALEGTPAECRSALGRVKTFLNSWLSHGHAVSGQATLAGGRFLIVSGQVSNGQVSGCSIDTLTRAVTEAVREAGCRMVSPMKISYQCVGGTIAFASRPVFRQLLSAGKVTPATPVCDVAISQLRDLRAGKFMRPLSRSPFARVFRVQPE